MGLFDAFGSDRNLEREGRWFEIASAANDDGSIPGFKMARMHSNNDAYQAALERVYKEHNFSIENETLPTAKARPILLDVFVNTILLDWRNIKDGEGKDIPFSKENAKELLTNLPDLYEVLASYAKKLGNFRKVEVEAATKKSLPPSKVLSGSTEV